MATVVERGERFLGELSRSRALSNPLTYCSARVLGTSGLLRFANGFTFPMAPKTQAVARELVELAAHGVMFGREADPKNLVWAVRPEENLVETPGGLRFALDTVNALIFAETFVYDVHFQGFDLTDKVVVDAGANVGDTALYFAQKGAEVHSFEPDPANYRALTANLALNPELRGRVHLHPAAVGADGRISFQVGLKGGSGIHAARGQTITVESQSLGTILRQAGRTEAFLLKADIKGAEFLVVRQPELARFERLAIEYTMAFGGTNLADFVADVRARGFDRLRLAKHNYGRIPLGRHGVLHAEKA